MTDHLPHPWNSAGCFYELDCKVEVKLNESYGAPPAYPREQGSCATMASNDSIKPHQSRANGHRAFRSTWNTSASDPLNAQPLWQFPGYNSQPDTTGRPTQCTAAMLRENYDEFGTEKLTCSSLLRMGEEGFSSNRPGGANSTQDHIQRGYYEHGGFAWGSSPFLDSNNGVSQDSDPHSAISASSHTITPSSPGATVWLSVADSAYGSLPNSSHGSGSSQADSMMHASHYFTISEDGISHGENVHAPLSVGTASEPHTLAETDGASTTKAGHTEQIQRLRQDAHSKVEKRYRMNINSKIEQLRRILPGSPSLEQQCLNQFNASYNSRRRKSGTELSKGDILSLAITNVQQLQHEVQQLTSQNMELKEKLALRR